MNLRKLRVAHILYAMLISCAMLALCAVASGCAAGTQEQSGSVAVGGGQASSESPSGAASSSQGAESASASNASTSETGGTESRGGTPFEAHGALHVEGTQVIDEHGEAFQIRGVSTHGLAWYPQYVNEAAFTTWRDWGANTVRLALYTEESGGWCVTDDAGREGLLAALDAGVAAATDAGMYVIIDWHILSDGNPLANEDAAKDFFLQTSARYAGKGNVIYEICNEPNGSTTWNDIYSYACDVIPVIRGNAPDALIVVGTPTWSQDVDQVAAKPLPYGNIVYALHFYAATHKQDLRSKAQAALDAGTPLLVSEFGICDASGNGSIDEDSAGQWMDLLDSAGVGYVCWNLSNKDEASALISSACDKTGGWADNDLSAEGRWYKAHLLGDAGAGSVAAEDASQAGLSVACNEDGTWEGNGSTYTLWRITVRNNGSQAISSWSASIVFDTAVELDDAWCADVSASGTAVAISPASYAASIEAGGAQESVGFIVKSSGPCSLVSAEAS